MKKKFSKTFGNFQLMCAWAMPRLSWHTASAFQFKYYTEKSKRIKHTYYHLEGWYTPKGQGVSGG